MTHPAESDIDIIIAEHLALRDPFAVSPLVPGAELRPLPLAPVIVGGEGVTTGETSNGRYPPGMTDSF